MNEGRYTVVAPTTGGMVWIERVRARPRLQASYAALKGDFRPLALSADYHNFVSGPLAAHGLVDGAHELLITEDIDSGRSWEIPVLIAHLLAAHEQLKPASELEDEAATLAAPSHIIWATGSVDPELHPQAADYAVSRKCELAAPLFSAWQSAGHTVHIVVPDGMPDADVAAITTAAQTHGFALSIVSTFNALREAVGLAATTAAADGIAAPIEGTTTDTHHGTGSPVLGRQAKPSLWQRPATRVAGLALGAVALAAAAWLALAPTGSGRSTGASGITSAGSGSTGRATEGTASSITVVRLGATTRSDCIDRIMLTQPMERTIIAMQNGAYRVAGADGLCGLRIINQSQASLDVRVTGDLVTAAIQGNDALFQGLELSASEATDLIFSRSAAGLSAALVVNEIEIPLTIETAKAQDQ